MGQNKEREIHLHFEFMNGGLSEKYFSPKLCLFWGSEKRAWAEGPVGWVFPVDMTPILLILIAIWCYRMDF